MQRNPVEPRPQARLAVKAPYAAENLDEDLLRDVGGIGRISQTASNKRVQRLMILRDENGKRLLVAGLQVGNECRVFSPYANRAGQISQECARLHPGVLYTTTFLKPVQISHRVN